MKKVFIAILFGFLFIQSKAQLVKFQPDPLQVTMDDSVKIIKVNFIVEDLAANESSTVNFELPASNHLVLNTHYRLIGPMQQTVAGTNNRGSFQIELINNPAWTIQNLHLSGKVQKPGIAPKDFRTDIIITYRPTNTASTTAPAPGIPPPLAGTGSGIGLVNNFVRDIDAIEAEYNCTKTPGKDVQMVQGKTFRESLKSIYSKVILNNDNVVKNGTAANLALNNGIDVSANYQKSTSERSFVKVGFSTKVKDGVGEIFSKKKFKNEFALSLGVTRIVGNPGRFFGKDTCEKLFPERQSYENRLKFKIKEYLKIDTSVLADNIRRYTTLSKFSLTGKMEDFNHYDSLLAASNDSLKIIKKLYKTLSKKGSEDVIRDSISDWEIKKAIQWNGYQVTWLDYDFNLPFTGYYFYDKNKSLSDTSRYTLMASFRAGITWNHVHYGPKLLWYLYGGAAALLDRGVLGIAVSDTLNLKSGDKTNTYYNVTNNDFYKLYIFGLSPSLNGMAFFGKEKVFGIEAGISWKYFFFSKIPSSKNSIWNARAGFVLSLNGEDNISKGTLGLFAQIIDYKKSDGKLNDNIGVGVRVGIPFNRLFKTN